MDHGGALPSQYSQFVPTSLNKPPLSNPTPDASKSSSDVLICGFNLSLLPRNTMFVVCVLGIFVTYIMYGALQEAIFRSSDMKEHSNFLTLIQFTIYSLLAFSELRHQRISIRTSRSRAALGFYCLMALLTLGTIAFSNASVSYLNYPTQVIFKCCKLIPVMIGGLIIQRKGYNVLEVSAVFLMTAGLVSFTMVDVAVQPFFTAWGVVLISMALCCDGALGNFQELTMRKFKCSNTEILPFAHASHSSGVLCATYPYYSFKMAVSR
ncbi:unnamed protein product [Dicrocoelium dendriticum]|nr:unnamed protein product [Dicrocoelium dendriticum]